MTISGIAVVASIIFFIIWGLNYGIDFTGGSLLDVKFSAASPAVTQVQGDLKDLNLGSLVVQPVGKDELILRFQDTTEAKHQEALNALKKIDSSVEELRYDSIGPSIGQELKQKSIYAIVVVLIAIIAYIAWAFRKVSKPVSSWKYGVAAIIALFHDVMITVGVFAILGRFFSVEVNAPFIAAILTVLGYSVNDTIVVFDRIRENLPKSVENFENTINTSINQTLTRSVYTSFTVILTLLAIIFFGGASIRDFAIALTIGVFVGTYSSIFVASPILVVWENFKRKKLSQ